MQIKLSLTTKVFLFFIGAKIFSVLADSVTTYYIIGVLGGGEGNPAVAAYFTKFGLGIGEIIVFFVSLTPIIIALIPFVFFTKVNTYLFQQNEISLKANNIFSRIIVIPLSIFLLGTTVISGLAAINNFLIILRYI
jgi:hypothetical protein